MEMWRAFKPDFDKDCLFEQYEERALPGVPHFAMLQNLPLVVRAMLDALQAEWNN